MKHIRVEEDAPFNASVDVVLAMTREVFHDDVRVMESHDPEIAGRRYFVFEVATQGSVEELATLDDEWHRRVSDLSMNNPG